MRGTRYYQDQGGPHALLPGLLDRMASPGSFVLAAAVSLPRPDPPAEEPEELPDAGSACDL